MKLRDIAQAAGTSLTTVSLVLNDKPGVSPEKREQIQQMLRDNGYEIRSAKASEGNGGKTICFLKYSKHAHLVNGNPGFVTQIMHRHRLAGRRLCIIRALSPRLWMPWRRTAAAGATV